MNPSGGWWCGVVDAWEGFVGRDRSEGGWCGLGGALWAAPGGTVAESDSGPSASGRSGRGSPSPPRLLCVAAAAASAGLHGADLRRGPVPGLARQYATVTAEVELTSDPTADPARVRGDHLTPDSVLIEAEVRRVEGPCTGRRWRRGRRCW